MEKKEREPVWVPIRKILQKVPGGRIIIPLVIGSIIVTISDAAGVKDPWGMVGSPSQYLFSSRGISIVLGFMLFFTGTQIDVRKMKPMLFRGFPLLLVRLGIGYALSYLFFHFTKDVGNVWIGISFVTFTSCLTSTNAGMFMGLVNPYGDDADYSYFGVLLLTALPAFPMLLIQGSQGGDADYMSMISILLPILFGMLLGNIDPSIRKVFERGNDVVIPFLGFQFGSAIRLGTAAQMIPQGLFLIACWYLLGVLPSFLVERYVMKRPGYISIACSAMAGVALSIPELVLERNLFDSFDATALDNSLASLALVLVVTSVLCPILTEWNNKYYFKHHRAECESRFPSLASYVEKIMDVEEVSATKKRVRKARKSLEKDRLQALSPEERESFVQQRREMRKREAQEKKRALAAMSRSEKLDYLRKRKIAKEDEEISEQGVYTLMVEKRNQSLARVAVLDEESKVNAYENDPFLDSERRDFQKELHRKQSPFELKPLSPRELSSRQLEAYAIAKQEFAEG